MQELTFPEITTDYEAPFDDYPTATSVPADAYDDVFVVLFSRTDANGKHHYMVAERWPIEEDLDSVVLTNAKEFKHAKDRAQRYFDQRRAGIGA